MNPELRQYIEQTRFCRATVETVAGMLPTDDAELDALLAEVVRERSQKSFVFLLLAALARERRVGARHLAGGAVLLTNPLTLGSAAWRMHGDVPEQLLAAFQNSRFLQECEAAALFLAAAWCREHRGGTLPEGLIPTARRLARHTHLRSETDALLLALATLTADAGLSAVLKRRFPNATPEKWQAIEKSAREHGEEFLQKCSTPILELVADKPRNTLAAGTTLRRAVARIGRNEPCPCGSGKKYKHCCFEKDQERLHHSSDVAGLTHEELSAQPEPHLTAARLERAAIYDLARFDPVKLPPALLDEYLFRLCAFKLFDRAAEAFEQLGYSDPLEGAWDRTVLFATRAGRKDIIRRLIDLRPNPAELEATIHLGAALALADEKPARLLELIDDAAVAALQTEKPETLQSFAYGLLFSKFRALGIFVGRSMIPILPQDMACGLFDELLEARDQLNLSPDDLFSDIMDKRFADNAPEESKDATALHQAQRSLDAKALEVQQLKESLDRLEKEIARREKPPAPAAPAAPSAPADERPLLELRQKVESLKSTLKERHNERNELRRQLAKAHTDLETLRQNAAPAAPGTGTASGADHEEDLLLTQESGGNQPVRLIEFPRNFHQTLAGVPRHVARGALAMLGRLAGGEAAAFVGAGRLKACPSLTRQRIGIDHRLLFRLLPDRVQVVDLIPRQDLERRIKTLV